MIRHLKCACLPFALGILLLGCSGQSDVDDSAEHLTGALSLSRDPVAIPVPTFTLQVSITIVSLGSSFTANVVRNVPSPRVPVDADQFDWGGEGLSLTGTNGPLATLSCTWAGFHTLEVTSKNQPKFTQLTQQIYCSPPLCA